MCLANDPAPIPKPHPSEGSYHWTFERYADTTGQLTLDHLLTCNRLVAAGLVPLTLAPFIGGTLNPVMDAVLCSLIVVHSHTGFQYVPYLA